LKAEQIRKKAESLAEKLTELRRKFHANPELPWQEKETSLFVEEYLRNLGLENIRRGFGGAESGVTADLRGAKPGKFIALRGDMDALPLEEESGVPYKSARPGVMHACGHDAHTAMLLGAAEILSSMKDDLAGGVRFIFQPAEEAGYNSGAPKMIEEGALDGVDTIGGLHIWAELPAGKIGWRDGPFMASADIWDIKIRGRGGHGAMPHKAVDPTVAAASLISTLQTVVSRETNPQDTVVLSVGLLEAGTAVNIIPETARVAGNIRTTNPAVRAGMKDIVKRVADGVCAALRCEAELEFTPIYPVTVNDPGVMKFMKGAASDLAGQDCLVEIPVAMGSEDFSYYGEKVPAAYVFLGMARECGLGGAQHHNPKFNVNDEVLPMGSALLSLFAARMAGEF
jgi:amidohydrolase